MQGSPSRQPKNTSNNQSKDLTILSLQDRNLKLKEEIERIKQTLENQSSILKKPLPRQNIVTTPSEQVMLKELQNANKQIRTYQAQLKNMDKTSITSVFEKIQTLEQTNGERSNEVKELKRRLYSVSKSIDGNSRKLTTYMPSNDDSEFRLSKLHQQASSIKYFVQQASNKLSNAKDNSTKQLQKILILQKNLLSLGVSQKQLEDVKLKCSRREAGDVRLKFAEQKEEAVDDRTIEKYNEMKNELKVLGKLQVSYEKQVELLSKDAVEMGIKSEKAMKSIQEMEEKIEEYQEEVNKMREKLKPVEIKKRSVIKKKRVM